MKVQFNRPLKALTGETLKEPTANGGTKEINLKEVCSSALATSQEGDGPEKLQAYQLAVKIVGTDKPVEVTAEDIALIKKKLEVYTPIVYGQACMMLEEN
ncbi:hypothetical protein [Carboxylicivirga marina]|uniref:Uncharacterized protein n=1 Tax=Carboxylicivirga marina TaxID=2800988 RepID=A0ABS1HGF9_9BACT|nr:hypothetical protein [Carboxylicivirga marina]MBK3516716.1 hypothetical protein [Carboxylicivirga marina]